MALTKVIGAGAEGLTLSTTDITITSGDLLFGTSAKGVNLGVTSNTDGNTIDDYEEGTWTPVVSDATSGGNTGSYSSGGSAGNRYIKVGRLVFVTMELFNINTSGMTSGNVLAVQGLPFSGHSSGTYGIGTTHAPRITVSGYESAVGFMDQNPYVRFFCYDLDGNAAGSIEVGNVTSGQGDLLMTLVYFSA
jgi:hypothetical protein